MIPEVAWGRNDDGTRWVTTIGPRDAPPIDPATLCAPPVGCPPTLAPAGHRAAGAVAGVVVRAGRPGHQGHARRRRRCPRQGRAGPRGHRRGRRGLRPDRPPAAPAGELPRLLPVPRGRLPRRQPGAARRAGGRRGPRPADGRHGATRWRSSRRRPPGRRAALVGHVPARAPDHDRHGVRHADPVVLLPRLRAGAVGGRRRQPAAPGHPGRGPPLATGALGDRARAGPPPDAGGQRLAPRGGPGGGSPSTRASTAGATRARWAGSTLAATAPSR